MSHYAFVCIFVQDDDLETDLNKLRLPPDPDRPKELLTQYSCFCPELSHDFQVCTSLSLSVLCVCVCICLLDG